MYTLFFIICIYPLSNIHTIMFCLLLACSSYIAFYIFTYKRFREIKALCTYLQMMYQGMETMDIREYCEGELSLLKSDLYKITNTLRKQADLLQKDKAFLAKSLSNISHQLKTPLTSMMVMNDLLQEELPPAKREEFLKQMHQQLKRIEWLVSTLLKMSKIDANAIIFHMQETSLYTLLWKACEPLRIPMELKEQVLELQCDEHIQIMADDNWIIEAFSNIIKNGMEHTPVRGYIKITCVDTPLHIEIKIQDDGLGIDAQDIPHIFARFYKGKQAANGAAGIGLSLTKSILVHHNADIHVASTLDKGSLFIIRFFK